MHQKKFKEHIFEKIGPDWSEYSEGHDVYVSHKKIIGAALAQNVNLQVSEDEAQKIIDVGVKLRRYIFLQQMPFDGSFNSSCQLSRTSCQASSDPSRSLTPRFQIN